MKSLLFLSTTAFALAGVTTLSAAPGAAQVPMPATPLDALSEATASTGTPPVAGLVESILSGEDDPAVWARLEAALVDPDDPADGDRLGPAEGGASAASRETSSTDAAAVDGWEASLLVWVDRLRDGVRSPEGLIGLAVLTLLVVAGLGTLVGVLRRRDRPSRRLPARRVGLHRPGRRRVRSKGATCRDAARLEARLRHRRAA